MTVNRPGDVLHEKPIEVSVKDKSYAQEFWDAGQPKGLKEVMSNIILSTAASEGKMQMYVGFDREKGGFDEKSKRKMSAYRALAFEHGFLLSDFTLNENSGTATSQMFKVHELLDNY